MAATNFLKDVPRPVNTYHDQTYDRIALSKSRLNLKGKTLFITGGSAGIGFSICKGLAEAGMSRIVIVARSPGPLAEAKKALETSYKDVEVLTFSASVTDLPRMSEIVAEVGKIDVLVLNAGNSHKMVPTIQVDQADMKWVFELNTIAPFALVKDVLSQPKEIRPEEITIINISTAAVQIRVPNMSGYGASKMAFVQIMEQIANEHSAEGVRAFSLHPGAFYTKLVSDFVAEDWLPWEDINLPAHFSAWLCTPEADFLKGCFVWSHWDIDELLAKKKQIEENPNMLKSGLVF